MQETLPAVGRPRAFTRADWLVPALLILLSLVPAIAGVHRLTELAGGAELTAANARFFEAPLPVILHVLAVIPYCFIGAFQFSRGIRKRYRTWHRSAGKVLAGLGLFAALSGLWMAHFYAWPEGDGWSLYYVRLLVGSAMAAFIVLALLAIRRRDFAAHGQWMMRAYALGIGAGTQVLTHLPWFIFMEGRPGELPRTVMMAAAWAINLAVAEWIIRRRRPGRVALAA